MSSPTAVPRKVTYRNDLFDPKNLANHKSIENTLFEFEGVLNENSFEQVLNDLFDQRYVVELILSNLSESTPLSTWILERFPLTSNAFIASFCSKILSKLALFFIFPPLEFPSEDIKELMKSHYKTVTYAPAVLQSLLAMSFAEEGSQLDESPRHAKVKAKGQRKAKQAQRISEKRAVDAKPFLALDMLVPNNHQEATEAAAKVLASLKSILEFYLDTIRLPDMAEAIRTTFIPRERPENLTVVTEFRNIQEATINDSTAEFPSAYPAVQPIKSALYFDSAEGFGEWQILISTHAHGNLREAHKKSSKSFNIIVKKIKELSNGHFSADNQKRLSGPDMDIPIFEAKMSRDLRLVYQIDCIPEYNSELERQAIKIFGIYTHTQLDNIWNSFSLQLGSKGAEYGRRCRFRKRPTQSNGKGDVFVPATFPALPEETAVASYSLPELPPDDQDQIHSLLVLEKYITFSQELLNSMLADLDITFPFQVSSREKEIIEHTGSCYVIGRSGTGKTTTMLFKMLFVERTALLCADSISKPHQIFVTQSRVLASKVEEYFIKMLESLGTALKSPQELKFLSSKSRSAHDDGLHDEDDNFNWRSDLPARFSELEDEHFPLFITFDRLCALLEADALHSLERPGNFAPPTDHSTDDQAMLTSKAPKKSGNIVTYDSFVTNYWPHFSQSLTKSLDCSLVFSEIMGVICGSEEAARCPTGFLDLDTYENLSDRTQSTFAGRRGLIYGIFSAYLERKRQRGDFDSADRTHALLRIIEKTGVCGRKVDHLYVDEAQDNLLIDALLLRSLCHNPSGLFWAGDTAQTISVGSSFRFNDLKAFLFRIEKQRNELNKQTDHYCGTQHPPRTFQLAVNYRSHAGIVNCAHSVIDLITRFWPYSIDKLARERGIVDGSKPIFFSGWDGDSAGYEQFLFGGSEDKIEFGADQCILVRDELACQRLREQVGDIGLIMTLYDSKGLEFNDVLLYNFFQDSVADHSQWRVVLNEVDNGEHITPPRFDESRHAAICSELKFLYVAITRARKNMWIADSSVRAEPMRLFWSNRHQIKVCFPGDKIPRLAVSSTPQEWSARGKELFERKRYSLAKHCYDRAIMPHEAAIASAYAIRDAVRKQTTGTTRQALERRQKGYQDAADAFLSCAEQESGKYRSEYFRISGQCFEEASQDMLAAWAYLKGQEYSLAARAFRKVGMFDEAVEIVREHEMEMEPHVVQNVKDVARLVYSSRQETQKAILLFDSLEDHLEFLEDRDFDVVRADLLLLHKRVAEAAELHLSAGRTLDAINLFLEDGTEHSMIRAGDCIREAYWKELSFGVQHTESNKVRQLTKLSRDLNTDLLDQNNIDELLMFETIVIGQKDELLDLGLSFRAAGHLPAAVLCFHDYFSCMPDLQSMTLQQISLVLRPFLAYLRLLSDLAFLVNPCSTPTIWKLFGFSQEDEDSFRLPLGTFLHQRVSRIGTTPAEDAFISRENLPSVFRTALCDEIAQRFKVESNLFIQAPAVNICIPYTITGQCFQTDCLGEHLQVDTITPEWYSLRVQVHMQQLLICQAASHRQPSSETPAQRKYWLGKLHTVLNPPHFKLGSPANLDIRLAPDTAEGFRVVKNWTRNLIYNLEYQPVIPFLTHVMRAGDFSFTLDENEASHYMYGAPFLSPTRAPMQFLRMPGKVFILPELFASLEGNQSWSLTAGLLFVRHIVVNHLPVDIGVLCHFIEHICSFLVLCNRFQRIKGLHDVTLPRSWLLKALESFNPQIALEKDTNRFWWLTEPIVTLIQRIHSGFHADHIVYGSEFERLVTQGMPLRHSFIARLCRCLCLVGYNIAVEPFRDDILHSLTSLDLNNRNISSLYIRYVYAESWDRLAGTVRRSMQNSSMDEMVRLVDRARVDKPIHPVAGVRCITYKSISEISGLLGTVGSAVEETPSGISSEVGEELDNINAYESEPYDDAVVEEGPEFDQTQLNSEEAALEAIEIPSIAFVNPTEEQLRAASIMQKVYKKVLERRQEAPKAGTPEMVLYEQYLKCLEQVEKQGWAHCKYRLLFLGPLPNILVCLSVSNKTLLAAKKEAKKYFNVKNVAAKHNELDEVGPRLNQIIVESKVFTRLQKSLEPTADVHVQRDMDRLKVHVQEALDFLQKSPFIPIDDLQADIDIVFRSVLKEPEPPKAPPPTEPKALKPKLCIDDEDERTDWRDVDEDEGYADADTGPYEWNASLPGYVYAEELDYGDEEDECTDWRDVNKDDGYVDENAGCYDCSASSSGYTYAEELDYGGDGGWD
ncbi:hypothetical protein BDQ12DRAFT_96280 [Crucibulum laeve]|uniref:UvrD-like helicase ATP-binding domain-containing protein n=1 Tax=Crucibulum laeve TaxID=68775 RepID=A0A5C3LZW5_9AGAR|nr:hypothetical protein BDQ12DRAFT_96280 [Crucibulum laeve]